MIAQLCVFHIGLWAGFQTRKKADREVGLKAHRRRSTVLGLVFGYTLIGMGRHLSLARYIKPFLSA